VHRIANRHRLPLREGPLGLEGEPMHEWQTLSHVRWDCKYHVVIIPKYRRRVFYGRLRRQVGVILRELCRQRGVELVEGHAMPDHVHLCLSIPPKYSVAYTIGFLKGKSAVRIHRELLRERRMTGLHFWAAGYCVSTVGLDEARVRQYIREQEELERRQGEFDFE
jgi:putative transposase